MRLFSIVLLFVTGSTCFADQWSNALIDTEKLDFGVIATGSETKKMVEIKNVYNQTLYVNSVSTSCKCAIPTLLNREIPPGESGFVEVKINTTQFRGDRTARLFINFGAPRTVQHSIGIKAYIRTDVVFTPGKLQFGKIDFGQPGMAKVKIAYAGRSDWDIKDIKFTNPHMRATLSPAVRGNGTINYELTMKLDDKHAPGKLRDLVTIVTNDKANPYIPLMMEGSVTPDITASPQVVRVSPLQPGSSTRVRILLKGKKPFRVTGLDCEGMQGCFSAELPDTAKTVHMIPVNFTSPDRPGQFKEELLVKIEGRPEPLRLQVMGSILN